MTGASLRGIDRWTKVFYNQVYNCIEFVVKERETMKRIQTLETRDMKKSLVTGGCGECQTSCQSACKTSCGLANQPCESKKD